MSTTIDPFSENTSVRLTLVKWGVSLLFAGSLASSYFVVRGEITQNTKDIARHDQELRVIRDSTEQAIREMNLKLNAMTEVMIRTDENVKALKERRQP